MYQGLSGELRSVHYVCQKTNECWRERVFQTTQASNGTRLALVPLETSLAYLGLFYQEEGGRFIEYRESDEAAGTLWENGKSIYSNPTYHFKLQNLRQFSRLLATHSAGRSCGGLLNRPRQRR